MKSYVDTIGNFLKKSNEEILNKIKSYNESAEESQIDSWKKIIDDLKNSSFLKNLDANIVIAIEYQFVVGNMAADIILAGYDIKKKENALLIEVKEWDDEYIRYTSFSNYREDERQLHPQVQVSRHKMAFKNYLDIGPNYEVTATVLDKNLTNEGLMQLINKNEDENSLEIRCFNQLDTLLMSYSNILIKADNEIKADLENASYKPARDVIESMNAIVKKEEGFILTQEQEEAMKEIISALGDGKRVIQIDGCAGSGKTALLINLYVFFLNNKNFANKKVLFCSGAQNTALYRSLYKEESQLFSYSFNLKSKNMEQDEWIIIMDEAQHNESGIITSLNKENITLVLAYDKEQAIIATNTVEELELLEKESSHYKIHLDQTVRYNSSIHFISNVKKLLKGNKELIEDDRYEFKILSSIKEVSDKAREIALSKPNDTFATIGLLSSNHDMIKEFVNDRDSIFFTKWSYKEECKWIPYINEKNYLNENNGKIWIGTWWMPGLDVDYAIVIVGPDAKLTKDGIKAVPQKMAEYKMLISIADKLDFFPKVKVFKKGYPKKLDHPGTARKIIEYVSTHPEIKTIFDKELNKLIHNIYYVMLTRARKGCYVYFMNDET